MYFILQYTYIKYKYKYDIILNHIILYIMICIHVHFKMRSGESWGGRETARPQITSHHGTAKRT